MINYRMLEKIRSKQEAKKAILYVLSLDNHSYT